MLLSKYRGRCRNTEILARIWVRYCLLPIQLFRTQLITWWIILAITGRASPQFLAWDHRQGVRHIRGIKNPTKPWVPERVFGESGSARLPQALRHRDSLAMQDMFERFSFQCRKAELKSCSYLLFIQIWCNHIHNAWNYKSCDVISGMLSGRV